MQSTQIGPNLIKLTRLRMVNAYLVREDDGFTLVDSTVRGSGPKIVAAARAAGGEIRRIALTHGHSDHVGALDALVAELDAVEVLMGDLDARIHAGERPVEGKVPGGWPKLQTVPGTRLRGGERVGSLEVLPSPGHTPGHVAFRDTRDGTLIAGDVFTAIGGLAVSSHYKLRFPFAHMATWDGEVDVRSAQALRELEPRLLAVGHGPVLRDPSEAIDAAIERAVAAR